MEAETAESQTAMTTRPSRRRRSFTSIQSKLLLMLLLTSILSSLVVGWFGYRSGTESLRDSTYGRLTDVRNERASAIEAFMVGVRGAVVLDSQGVATDASTAFNDGYEALADAPVTPAQRADLDAYYADVFAPRLEENVGGDVAPDAFVPTLPARSYLQANYTVATDDFDEAIKNDDAGDGSAWTRANRRFNPYFRAVALELGLDDVLLLDPDGNIVYSAYKGTDLGSNIVRGELRGGGLEQVFTEAIRSNNRDFVAIADFEEYQPSYGAPTMFIASPVGTATDLTGVLVYEVSADSINDVMTRGDAQGEVRGLGETGETYLVGPDLTMRSNSRELIEDPEEFAEHAIERGVPDDDVERMVRTGNSMLLMPTSNQATRDALAGESGVVETTGYLGLEVLDSYAPLEIEGLDWAIIAKIDSDEAFEPVNDFARNLLLATAAVILAICAASVLFARIFTAPLDRLLSGVRAVAGGQVGTQVEARSGDEFADLTVAFNDLSANLASKQQLLEGQRAENDRMLRSMMPDTVATRYRGGETDISEEHQDVSVVYTEIEGFDTFAGKRPAAEARTLLGVLSRGFDDAAREAGIEKVRSVGTGYVASSGLVVQRVDHARRVLDFALSVADMVERFNSRYDARLILRAGLHSGDVRSGLIGDSDVVYNLWGEAIDLAYRVRTAVSQPGIYATDSIKERLDGAYVFEEAGQMVDGDHTSLVWRVLARGEG